MKADTPHDMPTHLLEDPDKWITPVGKFLRKTSLDEIPQALNILAGHMSVVGPRPALWNQDDLVAERDKYGANDIRPGLSGWAQANGRDTLPIPEKAKLDGEYVKKFNLWFDIWVIIKTVLTAFTKLANSIMSNLLELEEKLIEMKSDEGSKLEEIDSLKKEIVLLKKAKDVRWTKNGYGTYVDEFGTEHNYCQHCFEKSNKLYEVPFGEYSGQCPECKNFLDKE